MLGCKVSHVFIQHLFSSKKKASSINQRLKISIQVAQNDCKAHHLKQVVCHLEASSLFDGRFVVEKWLFFRALRTIIFFHYDQTIK